jgi:hypothetical protein
VTPASGSSVGGVVTNFTYVISDSSGNADISGATVFFYNPLAPYGADQKVCWVVYNRSDNTVWLNRQNVWTSASVGTNTTLFSNNCTVNPASFVVSSSGNNLSLTVPVKFNQDLNGYAATQPVTLNNYLTARSFGGTESGFQQMGTWTVNPSSAPPPNPDFTISITPNKTTKQYIKAGTNASYSVTITGSGGYNGTASFSATWSLNGGAPQPAPASFSPASVTGSGSSTMTITTSGATAPGMYTVTVNAGGKSEFTYLSVSNAAPTVSVTPTVGTGSSQTFTLSATDSGTADAIAGINLLFNAAFQGANACWVYMDAVNIYLWLANDSTSGWTPAPIGSGQTLQNSQCTVTAPAQINKNGNTLSVDIPMSFKAGFAGRKSLFLRAIDRAGYDTGYITATGNWTVP